MSMELLGSWLPYHLLSYAFLTGVTLWHSFVSSLIARQTLPRPELVKLQSRLFPIYFSLQSVLSALCLLTTSNRNSQCLFLVGIISGSMNLFIFGPETTKLSKQRLELESDEGISSRFRAVHGRSVLANMVVVLCVLIYPFILSSQWVQ